VRDPSTKPSIFILLDIVDHFEDWRRKWWWRRRRRSWSLESTAISVAHAKLSLSFASVTYECEHDQTDH